jgi:DNA (cytosine-5)-methyltransferase 1
MPYFDLLCAGFPCQPFSQAGKRKGFDDTRGTLFFEIARVAYEKRPKYLLLENVPGIFTHDKGRTFNTILSTLSELGYHVEWQVLDSKDFNVPQSRKRVYAFCYLDERCAGKVLPLRGANSKTLKQLVSGSQGKRVYDPNGLSCTLTSGGGGFSGKCGMYFIDLNKDPEVKHRVRCITSRYNSGISNRRAEKSGVLVYDEPIPLITPERVNKRQNGKRYREPNAPMFTLTTQDRHGILLNGRIRKLIPSECLLLQGYNEEQIEKIITVNSDNQVYKQAGNSVTVSVVYTIGLNIKEMHDELYGH